MVCPIYDTMEEAFSKIRTLQKKHEKSWVNAAVITDGMENDSREMTQPQLQKMIAELKKEQWEISYYGANHNVREVGLSLNINNNFTFEAEREKVHVVGEHLETHYNRFCHKLEAMDNDTDNIVFPPDSEG